MQGFKELHDNFVQIGKKTFRIHRHDFRNGTTSSLEVGGSPKAGYMDVLAVEELQNIRIMDLPQGFSLDIYMPSLPLTQEVEGLSFKNVYGKGRCSVGLAFYYSDWKKERNLTLHSKDVAANMLLKQQNCYAVSVDDEGVGTRVTCSLEVPVQADLYQFSQEIDSFIKGILTQKESVTASRQVALPLKPDEHGVRWWIRYVVIPILGSATLLGLIRIFV